MPIIAGSGSSSGLLTVGGVPDTVNAWVKVRPLSQFMVLLARINIVFLIVGSQFRNQLDPRRLILLFYRSRRLVLRSDPSGIPEL